MKGHFKKGDRVHFVYRREFESQISQVIGTVVKVGGPSPNLPAYGINYTVEWDDVDYTRFQPSVYKAGDLIRATN